MILNCDSNLVLTKPESVSIKSNCNGLYNLYMLWWAESIDQKEKSLISLKSYNVSFNTNIEINRDYQDVVGGRGVVLHRFLRNYEMLYNLQFTKNMDILFEFQILNKGDGIMNYNVFEGLENYTVQVNVAGFTRDELSIVLEDGVIRIRTKPISKLNIEEDDCLTKNFDKYKSECEIYLPNVESVDAELKDGILYLNIPKVNKGVKIEL